MTLPTATSSTAQPRSDLKAAVTDESHERIKWLKRAQWIRAAILGANDGLISTTALMLGVGAAKDDRWSMIISGLAGALAGACSMAVGEFVSVSTQRDIEETLKPPGTGLMKEITVVEETYEPKEQVSPKSSQELKVVAEEMGARGAMMLSENDRDKDPLPNPYKAALASALAFLCGSSVPLASASFVAAYTLRVVVIAMVASVALAFFGGVGAHLGGSRVERSAVRVLVGGWMAMGITYGLLKPFDTQDD